MTNVLGYVSTLLSKASFPRKCSSFTIPGCFGILSIKLIYILTRTYLATLANGLLWGYHNYHEHLIMLGLSYESFKANNITTLSQQLLQVYILTILST